MDIKSHIVLLSPNSKRFKVFIRVFAVHEPFWESYDKRLFPKITIFPNLWDKLAYRLNINGKAFENG
jgi:hypothetical protein